jgi:hypothetical protein
MPMVGEKPPADSKTAGSRSSLSVVESRLTCMILRSSLGSVPSTASISDWRRKGSSMDLQIAVQRHDAVAARLVGKGDEQADQLIVLFAGAANTCPGCGMRPDRGQRELQQHRAHGAAKDDEGRGGLQNLAQVSAFDQQSGYNAGDRQQDSANARLVHESFSLLQSSGSNPGGDSPAAVSAALAGWRGQRLRGNVQAGDRTRRAASRHRWQAPGHDRQQARAVRRARARSLRRTARAQ